MASSADARSIMIVGASGSGKSRFARYLAESLSRQGRRVALLSADVGQPSIGVPTCLALSLGNPWKTADVYWFIGDTTPVGNLLPIIVGTARLMQFARFHGAHTVVIDTTGLVDGPLARALKYHKAIAAQVDYVVAIQRHAELEPLSLLLESSVPTVQRLAAVSAARDRTPSERQRFRQQKFAQHLDAGIIREFPTQSVFGADWSVGADLRILPTGQLVGLLNSEGFCLGLGMVENPKSEPLRVYTACRKVESVTRLRVGRLGLHPRASFKEVAQFRHDSTNPG